MSYTYNNSNLATSQNGRQRQALKGSWTTPTAGAGSRSSPPSCQAERGPERNCENSGKRSHEHQKTGNASGTNDLGTTLRVHVWTVPIPAWHGHDPRKEGFGLVEVEQQAQQMSSAVATKCKTGHLDGADFCSVEEGRFLCGRGRKG
ncbi:uncharacterized protein LOC135940162 [Cloeon dipterum]|uniref:uncharacterized protein LOC135940162 n=1 Tax=Cloeon dipterum TaxID=197152 RepID=UPI0032204864